MTKTLVIAAIAAAPFINWRPGGPCEDAYHEYLKARTFGAREFICVEKDTGESESSFIIDDHALEILRLQERITAGILNSKEEL